MNTKKILINISLIILVWVVGIFLTFRILASSTGHGVTVEVPDLNTFSLAEVEKLLEEKDLRFKIIDSTTFYHTLPKGSIIKQYPEPGEKVKPNRVLLLTINPNGEEKSPIPDLKDKSIRQAIPQLARAGFRIGNLRMVEDIAENAVLWCEVDGDSVAFGSSYPKRTKIDLIIGYQKKNQQIGLPDLIGRSYKDAMYTAAVNILNPAALRFDETVKDTLSAFVYRQYPSLEMTRFINKGDQIEMWFTQDQNKLASSSLEGGN